MIPNSVNSISWYVFDGCASLTSVTLPNSLIRLDYSVFSGCSSLESIEIPTGCVQLGSSLFKGCTAMDTIFIPKNIAMLDSSVFDGWTATQKIYFECVETATAGWNENWKKNCNAAVEFGVTREQYEAIVNPQPEGGEETQS
ncbi:MAG: leucine-rich repeat domain-containing protein [Clostridia bacterium]|nr:leucine-rich repeat domain-containing protein [Clostridia bacterium]